MFLLFRAITYATLFIGFLLIYIPANLLSWSGTVRPGSIELQQVAGILVGTAGALLAVWCISTFAFIGKGTPAPFDPPRHLVARGPYRFVRNPMYVGAGLALTGASVYYESVPLFVYAAVFLFVCHLFVLKYEEPALRQAFEREYEDYCSRVKRWWPTV
jgi:protein-S-isoprenylcysteine O-methyltransferase Ste14